MTDTTDLAGATGGRNTPSMQPTDRLLRELEATIITLRRSTVPEVSVPAILARVANGITGVQNGPTQRVLARHWTAVYAHVLASTDDEIRADDEAHRGQPW